MKKGKIFFLILLVGIFLSPLMARAADSCCVCTFWNGLEEQGDEVRLKDDGSLILDTASCDEHDQSIVVNPYDPTATQRFACEVKESDLCVPTTPKTSQLTEDVKFGNIILGIKIPGLRFSAPPTEVDEEGNIYIPWVGEYIRAIYNFSILAISLIAVVVIIMQGLKISASAGGPAKEEAQKRIGQAVVGLLIAWGSYVLLFAINPELTQLRSLDIKFISAIPQIDVIEDEALVEVPLVTSNGVPNFKQFDKRWGGEKYGYLPSVCDCGTSNNPGEDRAECSKVSNECCTTIQAAGCAPTSLAMVLSAYGVVGITPLDTANFIGQKGNGRVCNKGTNFNTVVKSLSNSPWSNFSGREVSLKQTLDLLKQKTPIIFLCSKCTGFSKTGTKSYRGHYMVLTGINPDGTIAVSDPGANDNRAIRYMTETQLLDNNGFWYVYTSG